MVSIQTEIFGVIMNHHLTAISSAKNNWVCVEYGSVCTSIHLILYPLEETGLPPGRWYSVSLCHLGGGIQCLYATWEVVFSASLRPGRCYLVPLHRVGGYQCKDAVLPVWGSHHKDKTVMRPSYLYNGNLYSWKDDLYIERGPRPREAVHPEWVAPWCSYTWGNWWGLICCPGSPISGEAAQFSD